MKKTIISFAMGGILISSLQVPTALAQMPESSDGTRDGRAMSKMDEGMKDKGMMDKGMKDKGMMDKGMSRMDADADGVISRDEFMQANEKMFNMMDKDADAELSEDEMKRGKDMMAGSMMDH